MTTDFSVLTDMAKKWKAVIDAIDGLSGRIHKELMKPLRDEGYWEGATAPYAWQMIDDIARQVSRATEVARNMKKVLEDGESDLTTLRGEVKGIVRRIEEDSKGAVEVTSHGKVRATASGEVDKETAKMVRDGQRDLNTALRGGLFIDSNLAYALMADVGLDQWFNAKPKHTNLDSTGSISPDDFDAYTRVMNGESPHADPNNATPRTTAGAWLTGMGEFEPNRKFHQGDPFVEQLQKSDSMATIRNQTLQKWREGELSGRVKHKISEEGFGDQAKMFAKDMAGLSGIDNLWGGKTNEAQSLLGSYDVDYIVKSEEPDGSIVVQYTLNNDTDVESFLPGYPKWQSIFNPSSGPGTGIHEKMTWTERIHPPRFEDPDDH
ncbi:hypothetical protein ACTWQF_18135 [Streptomyces sp. 8N114]|uniref:hypothetical protein n=1 Tax=Streptomyces sp. 8N114 TaxID=3457419 RepID=UPI003FD3CC51